MSNNQLTPEEIVELITHTQYATFSIPNLGEQTIETIELKFLIDAWLERVGGTDGN